MIAPMTQTKENDHERYFRWFCDDLKENGYLKRFDRELETFRVSPKIKYKHEEHFKVKENKIKDFTLFSETNYTYDARLIWTEKALNIFTEILDFGGHFVFGMPTFVSHRMEIDGVIEIVSYVDVKPHYKAVAFGGGKMASFYTFPFKQKALYMLKGLYINKVVPVHSGKHGKTTCLFATTFVPNRYLYHDKAEGLRSIPYPKRSLVSYAAQKKKIIDDLLRVKNSKGKQTTLL